MYVCMRMCVCVYVCMYICISSAESTTLINPFLQVFRKLKFNVLKGSEKSRFVHSTFIPGSLLYYIAIFKGDIFFRHGN